MKFNEPIAQRTRSRFKLQRPSEPRTETTILDKTGIDMSELLTKLIAQNKEQQDQIRAMSLVLEDVLAQPTTIVNKILATELLWQSGSKGKGSAPTSNEDAAKEVVKPFEPRVKANPCRTVVTTAFPAMLRHCGPRWQ